MQRFSLSDLEVLSCLREDLYLTSDHSHFRKVEHKNEWWEVALVNISGLFHSPLPIIKISAVNSTPVSLLAEPLIVIVWWKLVWQLCGWPQRNAQSSKYQQKDVVLHFPSAVSENPLFFIFWSLFIYILVLFLLFSYCDFQEFLLLIYVFN